MPSTQRTRMSRRKLGAVLTLALPLIPAAFAADSNDKNVSKDQ